VPVGSDPAEGEEAGEDEESCRVITLNVCLWYTARWRCRPCSGDAVAPPELKVRQFADLRARRTRIFGCGWGSLLIVAAALAVSLVASGGATI